MTSCSHCPYFQSHPRPHPLTGPQIPPSHRPPDPTLSPVPGSHPLTGPRIPPSHRSPDPTLSPVPGSHPLTGPQIPPSQEDQWFVNHVQILGLVHAWYCGMYNLAKASFPGYGKLGRVGNKSIITLAGLETSLLLP